jgi:hypothetical protein
LGQARQNRDLRARADASADLVWPGDEAKLMRASGSHAARQREALARALSDLVLGQGSCSACRASFESLDDLGVVIVVHLVVAGRELPTSPSFSICFNCCSAKQPMIWADRLMKSFLAGETKSILAGSHN